MIRSHLAWDALEAHTGLPWNLPTRYFFINRPTVFCVWSATETRLLPKLRQAKLMSGREHSSDAGSGQSLLDYAPTIDNAPQNPY